MGLPTPTNEEKAELTRMIDAYEAVSARTRSAGLAEMARLDTVGDWDDANAGWFSLEDPWRPKSELYARLAKARSEQYEVARRLAPVESRASAALSGFGEGLAKGANDIREGRWFFGENPFAGVAKSANDALKNSPFLTGGLVLLVVALFLVKVK